MTQPELFSVRKMNHRDVREALRIGLASGWQHWNQTRLARLIDLPHVGLYCVTRRPIRNIEPIVGWVYCMPTERGLFVNWLAVEPEMRRKGAGSALIHYIKSRHDYQRLVISACVDELRLDALLFMREHGFRAVGYVDGWFPDNEEPGCLLTYDPLLRDRLPWLGRKAIPPCV